MFKDQLSKINVEIQVNVKFPCESRQVHIMGNFCTSSNCILDSQLSQSKPSSICLQSKATEQQISYSLYIQFYTTIFMQVEVTINNYFIKLNNEMVEF